jgi:hypothetical protein
MSLHTTTLNLSGILTRNGFDAKPGHPYCQSQLHLEDREINTDGTVFKQPHLRENTFLFQKHLDKIIQDVHLH